MSETPSQPSTEAPEKPFTPWTPEEVKDVLHGVYDPELHMSIVELGLVYDVIVNLPTVQVKMTLTSPGCPYGPYLLHQVKETLSALRGVTDPQVEVVWEPKWGPDKMTEAARLELGFDI